MLRLTLLANLLLVLTIPAIAKDRVDDDQTGHTAPALYHDRDHRQGDDHGSFSSAERNMIRSWLRDAERQDAAQRPPSSGLPPGLQKNVERGKALPPGWQKKLTRGEPLAHEYYQWGQPLPDDLLRRLPPPATGAEILRIEDQIILIDAATRIILDVFGLGGN